MYVWHKFFIKCYEVKNWTCYSRISKLKSTCKCLILIRHLCWNIETNFFLRGKYRNKYNLIFFETKTNIIWCGKRPDWIELCRKRLDLNLKKKTGLDVAHTNAIVTGLARGSWKSCLMAHLDATRIHLSQAFRRSSNSKGGGGGGASIPSPDSAADGSRGAGEVRQAPELVQALRPVPSHRLLPRGWSLSFACSLPFPPPWWLWFR